MAAAAASAKPSVEDKEHGEMIADYADFFENKKGYSEEERMKEYENVVNSYYRLATDFYEYGWGLSFHFATQAQGEPLRQAIARHEHYLALKLGLKEGQTVVDCGCGVGGPAREIARFSGARVLGLNNNQYQVTRAKQHTVREKMDDKVSFVKGNFLNIPAKDSTFDAAYAIEATCHAPEAAAVYGEIFRVIKPGSLFAAYEWCMTDKFNPDNKEHQDIKHGIEAGDGIPNLRTIDETLKALKSVGFEIIETKDLVYESEIPWYAPLDGGFSLSNFRMTRIGRIFTHSMVTALEFLRLAPRGTVKTHDFLITAADNLVAGGKKEIFTPMFYFLVRKPEGK